jgi:hypothetical protein
MSHYSDYQRVLDLRKKIEIKYRRCRVPARRRVLEYLYRNLLWATLWDDRNHVTFYYPRAFPRLREKCIVEFKKACEELGYKWEEKK